jgi:hypothetical protein
MSDEHEKNKQNIQELNEIVIKTILQICTHSGIKLIRQQKANMFTTHGKFLM